MAPTRPQPRDLARPHRSAHPGRRGPRRPRRVLHRRGPHHVRRRLRRAAVRREPGGEPLRLAHVEGHGRRPCARRVDARPADHGRTRSSDSSPATTSKAGWHGALPVRRSPRSPRSSRASSSSSPARLSSIGSVQRGVRRLPERHHDCSRRRDCRARRLRRAPRADRRTTASTGFSPRSQWRRSSACGDSESAS